MKKLLQSLFILMVIAGSAIAQDRTITGTVTGKDDGLPVPGVSVKVVGTQSGTSTNSNGKYSLKTPSGQASIEFSSIGYITQKISIGTSDIINVVLVTDTRDLAEVVVTAQAIKREKRSLGYAAPTISSNVLSQSGSASPLTAMVGRVAGMNITSTSNTPGSSTRVVFRGGSSISGNNQALIVIDGVPVDNSSVIGGADSRSSVDFGNRANDIDPDDIESITPLLGPAAAALYGSRASNGAVVITTKSGQKGKVQITFNTSNVFSSILKLPDYQNEYGQGYYTNVDDNGNVTEYFNDTQENWSWGAPFTGEMQEWGQSINGVRQKKPYSALKDNIRNFFKTGFSTDNNLSFSGGTEKSTFYLALNTLNSNGIFPGDQDVYNKYGVRFNGKTDFSDKFSAGISFNYNKIDSRQIAGGQNDNSVYDNVLQTPRDIPLDKLGDLTNPYNGFGYTGPDGIFQNKYGYYGSYTLNPYFIIKNFSNDDAINRITGNINLEYKPKPWLTIQNRIGIDTYAERRRQITPKYSYSPIDENTNQSSHINNGGYEIDQFNVSELVNDLMITATHSFDEDFKGSLMLGHNIRQRSTSTNRVATNASAGLVVPDWYNLQNSNGPLDVILDNITKRRLVGIYADLNLSYKNYLFLQVTARNDWSSTLPVKNNSFFYPSVSGSFVFSEFVKPNEVFTYGKIRASIAKVGNDTDPYQLLNTFARGTILSGFGSTIFPFGNVAALQAGTTLGNANLKPEITTAYEIGTELQFYNNRLGIDFTYYRNKSKNQILAIPIPNSTGYGFSVINAGEVENKGIELALRGTVVKTSDLSVELFATYTRNNNKVVDLAPGVDQFVLGGLSGASIVAAKGRTYGEFYAVTNQTDAQGRTIVDEATGIPLATTTAQYLGSYNPKYQASFGTSITIKQHLNINVLFDMKHGNKIFSRTKDILAFVGVSEETGGKRFGLPFPNSVYLDANGNSVVNTSINYNKQDYFPDLNPGMNVIDGSFVKMRSAGISYTFNKGQLKNLPFGALSVGLFGNNLFVWTAKENKYVDPEVNSEGATNVQGFDFTAQPSVRNYGLNVKVTF